MYNNKGEESSKAKNTAKGTWIIFCDAFYRY